MGGLSKKAYQLEKLRTMESLPYLTVDAGNLLFKHEQLRPGLQEQAKITAEGIVAAYDMIGFDAVGVSRQDLAAGVGFLKKLQDQSKVAWLSINIVNKATKEPIFTPYINRKIGELNATIIGITGSSPPLSSLQNNDAEIMSWQETLPPLVAKQSQGSDFIVLLSNHTLKENEEIARSIPGIHIIIQSGTSTSNMAPKLLHNTLICQVGKQGKYIGSLKVNWHKSHRWKTEEATKLLQQKEIELSRIEKRLDRYKNSQDKEQNQSNRGYQVLERNKDQIIADIKKLKKTLEQQQDIDGEYSTFTNHFKAMEISMPDNPEVLSLVNEIKQKINGLGGKKTAQAPGPVNDNQPSFYLVGWQACVDCHRTQTLFWQKTGHAQAYQTLAGKQQNYNLDCLPCHVTRDPKSPVSEILSVPDSLMAVGCEVCHGPGRKHTINPSSEHMISRPIESNCRQCHIPDKDDNFMFEQDIEKIACPKL